MSNVQFPITVDGVRINNSEELFSAYYLPNITNGNLLSLCKKTVTDAVRNTFREMFDEGQRELLVEAVAFYEKHCKNQSLRYVDNGNCKSLDKIQGWQRKEKEVHELVALLIEESF